MSRLIFTAIGKFTDPDRPESLSHESTADPDFLFKCAVVPEQIILYEEWFENPQSKVYNHKGPFVNVKMSTCNERTLICTFEEFDTAYQNSMAFGIQYKSN